MNYDALRHAVANLVEAGYPSSAKSLTDTIGECERVEQQLAAAQAEVERLRQSNREYIQDANAARDGAADTIEQLAACRALLAEVGDKYDSQHECIETNNRVDADFVDVRLTRRWRDESRKAVGDA